MKVLKRAGAAIWARIRPYLTLSSLETELEPARIASTWGGLVAAGSIVGLTLPSALPGQVVAACALLALLIPRLAGEVVRANVTPVAKRPVVEQLPDAVRMAPPPGVPLPAERAARTTDRPRKRTARKASPTD